MRISGRALGVLAFAGLAFAGCGGGGGDNSATTAATGTSEPAPALSKAQLISQGDGICAEVNAAVGTVGSTSSEASGQDAQVAGLYSGMVERIKDLGPPSDSEAGYDEFIAAAEALVQAADNVKLASEREEGEALGEAEAEASAALTSFQSAAGSYGFEDCAEAPAAPTPSGAGSAGGAAGEEESPGGIEGEVEEAAPEEAEPAPEEAAPPVEEESAGGGAGVGGGTGGGTEGSGGGGGSGGIGPG